jgi:lipopolysaccharide exporter
VNFFRRIKDRKSLLGKGVRGGAWLMSGSAAEQAFRFGRNLLLARLLAPEAFGLMAIILSCCSLAQVLTAIGVREAVIQSPFGAERTYLNGVWWLSAVRGFGIWVIAFFSAPFIATFYEDPALVPLLRVAFTSMLVMGWLSPRSYVALKEMRYHQWALVQNLGGILGVATTITLAFFMRGVWALVIGYVAEAVFRVLISFIVCPFLPNLKFNDEHSKALWKYTSGLFGLPLLTLIYSEAAVFVVGKVCTKEELGLFALVIALGRNPSSLLVDPLRGVLMPTFASLQNQPDRLNRVLLQITAAIVLPALAIAAFVSFNAAEILAIVYGNAYAQAAAVLAITVICEVVAVANLPLTALFIAGGRPQLQRRFAVIRAVGTVVLLYPMVKKFGLVGAALAPMLALVFAFGFQLARVREIAPLDIKAYVLIFGRGLLFALPALAGWAIAYPLVHDKEAWTRLAIGSASVGVCYLVTIGVMAWRGILTEWLSVFRSVRSPGAKS